MINRNSCVWISTDLIIKGNLDSFNKFYDKLNILACLAPMAATISPTMASLRTTTPCQETTTTPTMAPLLAQCPSLLWPASHSPGSPNSTAPAAGQLSHLSRPARSARSQLVTRMRRTHARSGLPSPATRYQSWRESLWSATISRDCADMRLRWL